MEFPKDLRYTKDHEWARKKGDSVTVGITAFAVEQLGDITLVDLPEVETAVTAGEAFGTIDSVKSVSDLYAPVSGTVVRVNEALADQPELVNQSPYGEGWMVEIRATGSDYDALMDAGAYAQLVKSQA